MLHAFAAADADTTRPAVLFAYTIKGWGLPIAGDALNHSALLTTEQTERLREAFGRTEENAWDGFDEDGIVDAIERVTDRYVALRESNERFLDTYRRVGFEPFKEAIYG